MLFRSKLDETERHRSRDEMARELSESQQRLEQLLAEWRRMGGSKHQQDADQVARVAQQMTQMVPRPGESSVGLQQKLLSMTQTLDSRLAELLTGHSREVSERNAQFQSWTRVVLAVRQFFNLLGPVFGLYLGYRAASRLRKQISQIGRAHV